MGNGTLITTIALVAAGLVAVVLLLRSADRKIEEARVRGVYPEAGKETDDDVLRLLESGEKMLAIRCYRAVHGVDLKEAVHAVEELDTKRSQS